MMKSLVFFSVLALACASTNVQRCQSNAGALPTRTVIEGCRNPPCSLPQRRDAIIHITFTAPRNMNTMRTLATAFLGNVPINYPLGARENTCNFLTNTRCPITRGRVVNYTLRMYIEPSFPVGISTTVEFRIVDQSNNPVVCVRVPIRITASRALDAIEENSEVLAETQEE